MASSNHTPKSNIVYRAPKSPSVTVVLTQEKIDQAVRRDSQHCWISETIAETIPNTANVETDTATIRWTDPDKGLRYIYLTPQEVRNAIYRFDEGLPIQAFSFHLRFAQVRGVRRKDGAKKRMTVENWQKIKRQIRKISSEKGLKMTAIAEEMKIAYGTLQARLHDNHVPTEANIDKIEKWVLKHTGEKPAPRVKSQADRASGPGRLRSWNPKKGKEAEIIGGAHPARAGVNLRLRQHGLRQLHWKIPNTETHINPYPYSTEEENKR
jgi:hypothetical protein